MIDERACAMSVDDMKKWKRKKWLMDIRYNLDMFLHAAFWRTLYFFRVAGFYSRAMCRLGLYRKFPDGRCMYCGDKKQ
jgi:hypothetical protein